MQIGLALAAVLAIQDVAIIDVIEGKTLPRRTVVMKEGRISAITTGKPPEGATVVNGSGKFLIPGLWDMHTHVLGDADRAFPQLLAHGVTGIRNMHLETPGAEIGVLTRKNSTCLLYTSRCV